MLTKEQRDEILRLADRLTGRTYLAHDKLVAYLDSITAPEVSEQGPWKAELWKPEQVVVASDDFEHDARLLVLGDFSDEELRMQYAQEIARRLNMAQRVPLTNEQILSINKPEHLPIVAEILGIENESIIAAPNSELIQFARAVEEAHGIRSDK